MKTIIDNLKQNKILLVLISVLIICFILIVVVFSTYFFGGSKSSYGDRLNNLEKYKITKNEEKKFIKKIKEEKLVTSATLNQKGKILYIKINFLDDITLDEAKSVALSTLQNVDEKQLNFYDINFTIYSSESENSEGFILMGLKRPQNANIVWNNNLKIEEEKDDEKK